MEKDALRQAVLAELRRIALELKDDELDAGRPLGTLSHVVDCLAAKA
jgi:hypothetical protein